MQTPGERPEGPVEDGTGRLLAGRYRITARLGRGGMGVVWRAVDEVLGREVALKELRTYTDAAGPELADRRTRMQREARAAARVRHPGVIAVHDIAQHEGRPVIVMELVDGPSLDDVLRERGTLGPAEAAQLGAGVLDALAAAHRAGVLHRDVKPGNILLDRSGRVVLTDFGIAAVEDPDDGAATRLTASGELVGSIDYLAPERARGELPGPASDVWALGATLYAAVEGAAPFRRTSTWSTLTAIVEDPLPEPRRSGPLGPALADLMHKDPAQRAGAERAAALLEGVAAGTPAPQSPETVRLGRGAAAGPSTEAPHDARASGLPVTPATPESSAGDALPAEGEGESARSAAVRGAPTEGRPGPDNAAGPQTVSTGDAAGRGKRWALLAAAVAVVALAGAGTAYALLGDGSGKAPAASPGTARPGNSARAGGGSDSGSAQAAPQHACRSLGGGKHNCEVWQSVTSYDASHKPVGTLKKGTNYFYCQAKLPHRETSGHWTNVWWAKTDDDSGNAKVFVSDVYLKGGENDQPVPGLPVC